MKFPTSRSAIYALTAPRIDEIMVELGKPPFSPVMSLSSQRRMIEVYLTQHRTLNAVTRDKRIRITRPPKALPRRIPPSEYAMRMVFAAARSCTKYEDLMTIVEAHYFALGQLVDAEAELQNILVRIHAVYGWGVRVHEDEVVEVYC